MIVFKYEVMSVKDCHTILNGMKIPGQERHEDPDPENEKPGQSKIIGVWEGYEFIAVFYPEDKQMELYPIKNTNSINYFIHRYPELDWDTWKQVRTKRWK